MIEKSEEIEYEHEQMEDQYDSLHSCDYETSGGSAKEDKVNIDQKLPDHKIVIPDEEIKKHEQIRESGINYNEKMMVDLWNQYHFIDQQKFKFLYYDSKE